MGGKAFLDRRDGRAHAAATVVEPPPPPPALPPEPPAPEPTPPAPEPPPAPEAPPPPPWSKSFEGRPDDELLAPLRTGSIRAVKFNRGGSSISLRIEFDNGARA